jgi:hypothetical protein
MPVAHLRELLRDLVESARRRVHVTRTNSHT